MERIFLAGLNAETSKLGFGCASLGSRVAPTDGLRALEAAYERGVTWYDVAPAYGGGEAEALLGQFLRNRRDHVQICTKVGLAPPKRGVAKRAAQAALRPVLKVAAPLRAALKKSKAVQNKKLDLTSQIVRSSLEASLTRLGTERVEVYALHNADHQDLQRDDLLRSLEDVVSEGKAATIAVAGTAETARAALTVEPVRILQFAQPVATGESIFAAAADAQKGVVTHSVFGVAGALSSLTKRLRAERSLATKLAEAGFGGSPEEAAAALLLARARETNGKGVVLLSMFSPRSRSRNLEAPTPAPGAAALSAELGL